VADYAENNRESLKMRIAGTTSTRSTLPTTAIDEDEAMDDLI